MIFFLLELLLALAVAPCVLFFAPDDLADAFPTARRAELFLLAEFRAELFFVTAFAELFFAAFFVAIIPSGLTFRGTF